MTQRTRILSLIQKATRKLLLTGDEGKSNSTANVVLTFGYELVDITVDTLKVAFPPQARICREQRSPALRLQDPHPQYRPPVLQQFLLSAPDMDRFHEREVAPGVAAVHERQVINGHISVLLVVIVRAVLVAVLFVSPSVRFIPMIRENSGDQKNQGEEAQGQAERRYNHSSFHLSPFYALDRTRGL